MIQIIKLSMPQISNSVAYLQIICTQNYALSNVNVWDWQGENFFLYDSGEGNNLNVYHCDLLISNCLW